MLLLLKNWNIKYFNHNYFYVRYIIDLTTQRSTSVVVPRTNYTKYTPLVNINSLEFKSLHHHTAEQAFMFNKQLHTNNLKSSYIYPKSGVHSLFTVFTSLLMQNVTPFLKVHPSCKLYFSHEKKSGTSIYSLSKLFNRWYDFFNLIFNILYFNINCLYFGNSIFKNEVLSLNWLLMSNMKHYWRYVRPYLYLKPHKINDQANNFFASLSKYNTSIAFVFDTYYHTNTVYYLKRWDFYTIGPMPITSNMYNIHLALPVSNDSVFMHLFFMRLVFFVKKSSLEYRYLNLKSNWFGTL